MKSQQQLHAMVAVGAVTASSARIWLRSDRSGPHRVVLDGERAFAVDVPAGVTDHTAACELAPLAADTDYRYVVHAADGAVIGSGRFRTAPLETSPRLTFAMVSCHQPFADDGTVRPSAPAMLRGLHELFVERDVRFVLGLGDQIYADEPHSIGVFREPILELPRDEVRRHYHRRYREAWALPELQRLYADFPTWPMLDDHEVADNFGSLVEHSTPAWTELRAGALAAYRDYQHLRIADAGPPFDHGFRWGGVAVYQLDVRSERYADPARTQVFTQRQLAALAEFLRNQRDARVLVLGLTIPIAYVPTWFSTAAALLARSQNAADRWSHVPCLEDRDRLLRTLLDHATANPRQLILLASGDVHVGSALELRWDHGPTFLQLTSSPVTNELQPLVAKLFELIPRTERIIRCGNYAAHVERIPGDPDETPYGGLNAGIVEIEDDGARARVRLELVGMRAGEQPRTVYRSPWLSRT